MGTACGGDAAPAEPAPPSGSNRRTRQHPRHSGEGGISRRRSRLWPPGRAGVAFWPRPDQKTEQQTVQAAEPTDDTVAVLLHSTGAVWGESTVPTRRISAPSRPDAAYWPGCALEFYCGATVILEGPIDFNLISRTRASCTGAAAGDDPRSRRGFTIETPALDVVDRGTEVGLRVGAENRTEVHVFKGRWTCTPRARGPRAAAARNSRPGRASGSAWRRGRPDPVGPGRVHDSQKLENQLAEETACGSGVAAAAEGGARPSLPRVLLIPGALAVGRTLIDRAGRLPSCDGAIVGCPWVAGRWPGRQGLEFRRVSDRVRLHVPESFDSVTLAAWVRSTDCRTRTTRS